MQLSAQEAPTKSREHQCGPLACSPGVIPCDGCQMWDVRSPRRVGAAGFLPLVVPVRDRFEELVQNEKGMPPQAGIGQVELERLKAAGVADFLSGIASLPTILASLEKQQNELSALRQEIKALHQREAGDASDAWLDAKDAARYLGMSPGTFDKYRYQTSPTIKGYRVGGKTLYKRADLDAFVILFEARSGGLA